MNLLAGLVLEENKDGRIFVAKIVPGTLSHSLRCAVNPLGGTYSSVYEIILHVPFHVCTQALPIMMSDMWQSGTDSCL